MIQKLINRYKRMRTEHYLCQTYQYSYAFIGMGQHSLTNLYPVLHYLGVPLKYICVTSERKTRLIEQKFAGTKATNSLDEILNDKNVKGVFVATSPTAHFSIASQVLHSGKSLFIEKPPCHSLAELDKLIALRHIHKSTVTMAGLQKRYAPAIQILKKRLNKERPINYDLHYLTGCYPEGDAMFDLYIHPIDLICYLFGQPQILSCQQTDKDSYILTLQHQHIVGTLELSTAYTWSDAEETLKICTRSGVYQLTQMDKLTFSPKQPTILGIPLEKLHAHHTLTKHLYHQNNFSPILPNNQIFTQGYFNEITAFVNAIEKGENNILTDIAALRDTYEIICKIKHYK